MRERKEQKPKDLSATIKDARMRIDKKLGVPAHETATQVERVAKELYSLGAVDPRLVIEGGEVVEKSIMTFGTVKEGFVGSVGSDGIMRFGPKEVTDQGIALNLDKSLPIHRIPQINERQIWRTTLEWGEQAMSALTTLAESFMTRQVSKTTQEITLEEGRPSHVAPRAES